MNSIIKEKFEYLWGDEPDQIILWIETFIRIVNKQGKLVKFILSPEQREFIYGMGKENIILKARQLGLSSIAIALSIRECIVKPNSVCALVSHSQSSTNSIFDKLKQQYDSLPSFIKPKLIANNRQELKFDNGSKITCLTCGNKELFRGETLNGIIHLSEFAYFKDPEKQLASLSQAISSSGRTICESTAKGFNKFAEMYFQAKDNEISYKPFFYNWIDGTTLFQAEYREAVKKYKAQKGRMLTTDDLTDDEIALAEMGASLDQICWRRLKIADNGLEAFSVEYPATDMDCFITSGATNVFNSRAVSEAERRIVIEKVKEIPKNNIVGLPASLKTFCGTSLKIYDIPQPNGKYWIGVDTAEGLGGARDFSTIVILDDDGKEVASFRSNKLKPYQFSEVVYEIAKFYNNGHLIVEKASGGHTVISKLYDEKKYRNMHKYISYDEIIKKNIPHVGFDSNSKTKPMIIRDCVEWFETGLITINSREILDEMKVFQQTDGGKYTAVSGKHDDLLIALCLAVAGMKKRTYYFI